MHLSYQEVPLNGIILLTGDALSLQRDLQLAAEKTGGIESESGNTAAQRAWSNNLRHLFLP